MAEPDRRQVLRKGLGLAALILGSMALAVLALSRTELGAEALTDLWARTRPGPVLLSLAVMCSGMFFLGARWKALIPDGEDLPVSGLGLLTTTGLLLNVALPGPAGELAVAVLAQRRWGVPATNVLAGGVTARFIGLSTAAAMGVVAQLSGQLKVPPDYQNLVWVAGGLIALAAILMGAVAAWPALLMGLSRHTVGRLRGEGRLGKAMERIDQELQRMALAMKEVTRLPARNWLRALGWSLGGHACVVGGILIGAWGIGAQFSVAGVVFTYSAATAGIVAMFAVPGGQLGWDALFVAFLHLTAGLSETEAVAVTALVRLQQTLLLLFGAVTLALTGGKQAPAGAPQPAPPEG